MYTDNKEIATPVVKQGRKAMGLTEIARLPTAQFIKWDLMTKNTENETSVNLRPVEKKSWQSPKMTELNIRETKSADRPGNWEIDLYFFQIGGTAS